MYIYKTVNLLNGKIYVGQCKFNPKDNPKYLGSGYILKRAIKCYGEKNFKKEILEICKNKEQLCERERYWIAELKANHRDVGYNICEGGEWGDNWAHHPHKEELRKKFSKMVKGEKNPNYGNRWTNKQKERQSIIAKEKKVWIDKKTGLPHCQSLKARKKASEAKLGLQNPNANLWKLISPIGEEFTIEGGIKREIKKYGFDYQTFTIFDKKNKNIRYNRKGWKLIKIQKENI